MHKWKFWSVDELVKLKNFCQQTSNFKELKATSANQFEGRSWSSIESQVRRHPAWIEHFGKEKIIDQKIVSDDDNLGFSPEELEIKLKRLKQIIQKGPTTVTAISEDLAINVPKEDVWPLIDKLREQGYDIIEEKKKIYLKGKPAPEITPSLPPITKRERIEVLFMSDLCLGLKTQQSDLLATCLKIGEQREVFFNQIIGNLVAGKPPKGREEEFFLQTSEEQAEYVVSCFPKASFNTYLLNGSRELSFTKGKRETRIESLICQKRDDIRYIGDEKEVIPIGRRNAKVAITAAGGYQAYTKSYPLQGIIENFQEAVHYVFEHSEPFQAVIVGGLHSGILIPRQLPINKTRFNDFDGVAVPALHRISPSQVVSKRRGASPVLGCLVLGVNFEKGGEFKGFTYSFYDLTAYFKDKDYLEDPPLKENLSEEERKILLRLKKKPARRGELSNTIRKSVSYVEAVLEKLKNNGYEIFYNKTRKAYELKRGIKREFKSLDLSKLFTTKVKILATSDWHVGHKLSREDLIKKVMEIAEEKKVDLITNSGNLFEGVDSYSGQAQWLYEHGADAQRRKLLQILPKSEIPMLLISSPLKEHDGVFWKWGHDIVYTFVEIAEFHGYRVVYLGNLQKIPEDYQKSSQGRFKYEGVLFDLQHPKGGLPYGQTYRLQRRIESLVSVMDLVSGVKVTFVGHLHRAAFMLYKGMAGFLVPSLQETTEYITALDKIGELGVWVIELAFDEYKNLTKVELEYIPFEPKAQMDALLDLDSLMEKWMKEKIRKK